MKKGSCVRPQEIGVMASAGVTEVEVFRPWEVTVISTGDELVSVEGKIKKGQTRDINTYSLSAAAEKHGFHVVDQFVLRDDRETIKNAISRAMERSDIVLVSGGSSQGEKDYTADIMDELSGGGLLTHGIAIKPGKPTILEMCIRDSIYAYEPASLYSRSYGIPHPHETGAAGKPAAELHGTGHDNSADMPGDTDNNGTYL